ncbi:Crp/Fnr family transcriptional regulator [Phenylobacterium sp.]|uniref:Crp/Fnr family transcriptional regulator n=1 Tax=Phenylobacterium sp. TaxID=1871053 RepID=UPI0027301551|nr:Crp/Fnr family transcriptional regulator [Phenylobacterium sp.]MDP1617384.1 Crp/Fnr family transcriptional regulator [Phenylobacterium sp.]MDP1985922.1 Crp/Fnr family transcriptional regulator [Phenylobacterium sp.]
MPENRFLSTLGRADAALLGPALRARSLARDDLVACEGRPVERVVLPVNCILSVIAVMRDGREVETRTIGFEGGYGLLHALGSPVSYERVIAQVPGDAYELPLAALAQAAQSSPSLVNHIVSFAQASLIQSAQTTACNAIHGAEQRMCRWLLMSQDRLGSNILPLTQEHLSIMLGVQRTTVTAIAKDLQARGLIANGRGRIKITDREGLKRIVCECYEMLEDGVTQMVGFSPAAQTS